MSERLLPIAGCEGYEVSDLGRVRSWRIGGRGNHNFRTTPRVLNRNTHPDGYKLIHMSINGERTVRYVHHLVLEAFVGPCPEGMVTRHLDNVPSNNRLDNIVWGTDQENWQDQVDAGRDTRWHRNARARFTEQDVENIRRRLANGERGSDLAREFEVSPATISRVKHRVHYDS